MVGPPPHPARAGRAMAAEESAFWGWDRDRWLRVLAGGEIHTRRQLVLALVAYLLLRPAGSAS